MSDAKAEARARSLANLRPFQPGNPGRPRGSRNKLAEHFIMAMHDDFLENGKSVIETVRREKPDQYLKVIASLLPKELHVKDAAIGDLSDSELMDAVAGVRHILAERSGKKADGRNRAPKGKARVRGEPSELH